MIIAVDGRSGAGKTTVAVELAALLRRHRTVSLFHLEDIYPGWDGLAGGVERYIGSVLEPLHQGLPATWTAWDWEARNDGASRTTAVAPVVLVEGVGSSHGRAIDYLDAVIWVDAPRQARKQRALERDGETYAPFWDAWAEQEERLLGGESKAGKDGKAGKNSLGGGLGEDATGAAWADIVVDGTHGVAQAPNSILDALTQLPALEHVLGPELARRRGLEFSADRIAGLPDAAQLFHALYGAADNAVWLDSSITEETARTAPGTAPIAAGRARFSIMADPSGSFGQLARHESAVTTVSAGQVTTRIGGPFFSWLDSVWGRKAVRAPEHYPGDFTLGWLGYLGYELKAETGGAAREASSVPASGIVGGAAPPAAPLPAPTLSALAPSAPTLFAPAPALTPAPLPAAALLFAGLAVVLDHQENCLYVLSLTSAHLPASTVEAEEFLARVTAAFHAAKHAGAQTASTRTTAPATCQSALPPASQPILPPAGTPAPRFTARDGQQRYKAMIAAAQEQIHDGNTYEVCLTTQLEARTAAKVDAWAAYQALRKRSPAPFAAFMKLDSTSVCSTSPERFLCIAPEGLMRAEPIKGTRRRDANSEADAALKRDLATSLKDRAENIMIVDLLRNDLSRFALPESLTVPRLCAIESYTTVHQMVSTIEAQLAPGSSRAQAVAAAFPAGSMTGAPKISTMAILDTLEAGPRGIYSGAIGYFSLNAAMDLSVVIRTLVLQDTHDGGTQLSLGIGGAITADSDDEAEWQEIQAKAYGVLSTLGADFPL
ncbi:aminodeoxychorismate synthase component I [Arthrobacter sp. H35-D1]|uniref:aminodeoxychorismate synthase component I n=1 Tax=Arthrobacter sp. H35-D1 TaxID=3046202 RepID=UPI0024BACA0C|nr:aminodeoxychorismate synthase component I [Arthrobacter sp. H35-D1]MDJ0311902.1 aminodeoxychorismate synthase component I [Arthrobacter sp. H35-D1]